MKTYRALFFLFVSFFIQSSFAEKVCGRCENNTHSCRVVEGGFTKAVYKEACVPAEVDQYCTSCAYGSGETDVMSGKAARVGDLGQKWISYRLKSKSNSPLRKFWCNDGSQPCSKVMDLCEKSREEDSECKGVHFDGASKKDVNRKGRR